MESQVELGEQSQYLTFQVAGALYAVGILQVKEIITYRMPTRVPMTPEHVPGVINLRGSVVPIVDLGKKFGFPDIEKSKRTCIIVADVDLGEERTVMGILVEAVNAVIELSSSQIEEPPTFGTQVSTEFLRGMGKLGHALVPILDLNRILSTEGRLAPTLLEEEANGATADEPAAVEASAEPE